MAFRFRKTKKIGGLRVTASKSGLSVSGGMPGLRVGANSKGQVRRTVGVPGSGLYDTKVIGNTGRGSSRPVKGAPGLTETTVQTQAVDAACGRRDLLDGDPSVAHLKVVGVSGKVAETARMAGIAPNQNGWTRGIRPGLLLPAGGDDYNVVVMVEQRDNPALFGRRDRDHPKGLPFGRLGKSDVRRWTPSFAGRSIMVVVYLDATPGFEHAEVRFFPSELANEPGSET